VRVSVAAGGRSSWLKAKGLLFSSGGKFAWLKQLPGRK